MALTNKILRSSVFVQLLLIATGFAVYFGYYHEILLSPNSVLSGITGDALKNYYTFVFHITNDTSLLHFTGMNYPFGEHVLYTDCQPLLTFIFRTLPLTHPYLVGILHWLLFLSFMLTPWVLFKIFQRLNLEHFTAFFLSLGITLLSPQFGKIAGGHHGLAYGCLIPISILFVLEYVQKKHRSYLIKLGIYNFILFFIHPYMGFSVSVFSILTLLFYFIFNFRRAKSFNAILSVFIAGILPILLFRVFMKLTDEHLNRTAKPQGLNVLVENTDSLLAPDFGPFQEFLESIFTHKIRHLEGHSYLGIFMVMFSLAFLLSLPFFRRKYFFRKELLALLISSLALLFISFGLHYKVFEFLGINSSALNQFRAVCRFAWMFYYVLPIFLFAALYHSLEPYFENKFVINSFRFLAMAFLASNFLESHFYFKKDQEQFWIYRNVLNETLLNTQEREVIQSLREKQPLAIVALPVFHIGSETYARWGGDNSMIPSMIYSYHANIPIFGVSMSRTSVSETEHEINLLNSYKIKKDLPSDLNERDFFIIETKDPLLADEMRLLYNFKAIWHNDSLNLGYLSKKEILTKNFSAHIYTLSAGVAHPLDTNNIVYIPSENRSPFIPSVMKDYHTIYVLDSNNITNGRYIISFHLARKDHQVAENFVTLIVTRGSGSDYKWQYYQSLRLLSGFYPNYAVFEYPVELERGARYEFVLKGDTDQYYQISNFLLRPEEITVMAIGGKDTLINNFGK